MVPHTRVYLAARFKRIEEMRRHAEQLMPIGYEITSRWLDEVDGKPFAQTSSKVVELMTDDEAMDCAINDLEGVEQCDLLLAFTDRRGSRHTGGGRHTELGAALALRKEVFLIGEAEQVFHCHPTVRRFPTWEEAYVALEDRATTAIRLCDLPDVTEEGVLALWEKHALATLELSAALDHYIPGVGLALARYQECRRSVYRAAMTAWKTAGSPYRMRIEDPLAPDSQEYAELHGMIRWYGECVDLARLDHSMATLQARKADTIARLGQIRTEKAG